MMIDIMNIIERNAPRIDAAIETYIPKSYIKHDVERTLGTPSYSYNLDACTKSIAEPAWDFLSHGGKRWRPTLFLLVCEAFGGDIDTYFDLVVLLELLHNGSVIIDDIEDGAQLRRGRDVLHKTFGVDVAVNAGNALYFLPLLTLLRNKKHIDDAIALKIYEAYAAETIRLHFGQGMDIAWHKGLVDPNTITERDYLQMCANKSGTLARLATVLGAVVSGCSDDAVNKMGHFGESIGVAFQIQDDILDIVAPNRKQFGKPFGNDITEGKKSLMVIHTLAVAPPDEKKRLLEILRAHTHDTMLIQEAIDLLHAHDSITYAKGVAQKIVTESWSAVDTILPNNSGKEKLRAFADFLIERSY